FPSIMRHDSQEAFSASGAPSRISSGRGSAAVRLQACQGLYFVHAWGLDAVRSDLSLRAPDRPAVCYIPVARQDAVSSSSSPGCRLAIGAPADGVACPREGEGNSGPAWQATRSVASRPAPLARVPGGPLGPPMSIGAAAPRHSRLQ